MTSRYKYTRDSNTLGDQVQQALYFYHLSLVDEKLDEASALDEVHKPIGGTIVHPRRGFRAIGVQEDDS